MDKSGSLLFVEMVEEDVRWLLFIKFEISDATFADVDAFIIPQRKIWRRAYSTALAFVASLEPPLRRICENVDSMGSELNDPVKSSFLKQRGYC